MEKKLGNRKKKKKKYKHAVEENGKTKTNFDSDDNFIFLLENNKTERE